MSIGQGSLSVEDLLSVWESSVDEGYAESFVAAGEGEGLEAFTQGFAQLERASEAIDVTTQALYILPWSGQTNPPAAGEQAAVVQLTFTRSGDGRSDLPLRVAAGQVFFQEEAIDWGDSGPTPTLTGRRYTLVEDLVLMPGDNGPITAAAVAERAGWGYNNPRPGTIVEIDQPGVLFTNTGASVSVASTASPSSLTVSVTTPNTVDTFLPEHVGQYVILQTGANAGTVARIVGFQPPMPPSQGSTVQLEPLCVVEVFSAIGAFVDGETVNIKNGVTLMATATFVAQESVAGHARVAVVMQANVAVQPGWTVTGAVSATTGTIGSVLYDPVFANDVGNTGWTVVGWDGYFGLEVTNNEQPDGGRLGLLDAIGYDRNLPRNVGEDDDTYRKRVHQVADVVTPNAVRRMLNRLLGTTPWCFREAGLTLLPGCYFDHDPFDINVVLLTGTVASGSFVDPGAPASFQERVEWRDSSGHLKARGWLGNHPGTMLQFVPTDGIGTRDQPAVAPASGDVVVGISSGAVFNATGLTPNVQYPLRRFRVLLDYTDFRAFFLIGLPVFSQGDFGFSYDNHPDGFYDGPGLDDFYDGFAVDAARFYKQIYQAIDGIRAGGVVFDLYQELGSCE